MDTVLNRRGTKCGELKERFVKVGLAGFLDREVLELLLGYSMPRRETHFLAESLLGHYGSFQGIIDASLRDLVAYPGMDGHSAILFKFIKEGGEYYLLNRNAQSASLNCWTDVVRYCRESLEKLHKEFLQVLFLDYHFNVVGIETLYEGEIAIEKVHPRKLIEYAITYNAYSCTLFHNHISGDPNPSEADIQVTERLVRAARSIELEVQDHLIIGENRYYSFRDSGRLYF